MHLDPEDWMQKESLASMGGRAMNKVLCADQ